MAVEQEANSSMSSKQPPESDPRHFLGHLLLGEAAIRTIPAREPEHSAKEAECRDGDIYISKLSDFPQLLESFADEVEVGALPFLDRASVSRRKTRHLVGDDGDWVISLTVAAFGDEICMTADDRTQALFWFLDLSCWLNNALLESLHAIGHELVEHLALTVDVVIDARLCHPDGIGDVIHRSGVKAFFADDLSGNRVYLTEPLGLIEIKLFP